MKGFSLVIATILYSVFSISIQAQTNQPPVAGDDSYTVHGATTIGSLYSNDYDPEGDYLQDGDLVSYPAHGTISGVSAGYKRYTPNYGYYGSDSFTYSICDSHSLCATGTVNITVSNAPPVGSGESYAVRGSVTTGHLLANDTDPDADTLQLGSLYLEELASYPTHGMVYGTYTTDIKQYVPQNSYVGPDNFSYNVCDSLGRCTQATVNLFVFDSDGMENGGPASCNANVGEPVNVTSGNMYLSQQDYQLPGVGGGVQIIRTYSSTSQRIGLFGRGWTTTYDELIQVYDGSNLRLLLGSGQAVYFSGSGGTFTPRQTDFVGTIVKNADNTFTLTQKDGSLHRFNSAGKLLSITDRNGNQISLAYNANNKLASITDPFGRVLSFTSDPIYGYVYSISDSLGTVASYTYGASLTLSSVSHADGSMYQFSYASTSSGPAISQVTDGLNNVLEAHTYDSQGRATTSEKHGGVEHYSLSYVSSTETDITDAIGHITKYFFDKNKGRFVVTKVEGSCGCGGSMVSPTWSYDDQLNITSKTDALGLTTSYTYDTNGNLLTKTDARGMVTYTYDSYGQMLTATDSIGTIVTNTYDSAGNLTSVKDALNNTTFFTYNTRGLMLTSTDRRNNVTSFAYDSQGNLSQQTDAANNVTSYAYDARGRITSATDALNHTTSYEYDLAGRVKKITSPDATYITFTYDLAGHRTKFTDARNNSTNYAYDNAYRLTSVTNADNKVTSYSYDSMSNLIGVTDALSRTTNYEYDSFNRLTKIINPSATTGAARLNEQIAYDAGGRVTSKTDQAGQVTTFEYDNGSRLIKVTNPALKATQYEYNARSQVTAVVDALNQRYAFTRDSLGHVTQLSRGGVSETFTYDAEGNPTGRVDYNGVHTSYTYDALNRLVNVAYPDSSSTTYVYDKLSRLTSATNSTGTVSFSYNSAGRTSSTTDVSGQVINYLYDANGNRTQTSLGTTLYASYAYDSLNRMTGITDSASVSVGYSYNAVNRAASRTLPNGVATTRQYDGLDRLTSLTDVKGQTTLASNQYQQDALGNITQAVDQDGTHNYGYDVLSRLTSASHTTLPTEIYAYDAVGNRSSSHWSTSYSYQAANQLTSISAATYSYDNNGNLISKTDSSGTTTYTWDYENRLVGVTPPTWPSVTYKYDALERRTERRTSTADVTTFIYEGQNVLLDRNVDGSQTEYLNGPGIDNKLRQTNSAGTLYFLTDHLGSTRALTDASSNIVEQMGYDGFGDGAGSSRTRYGYTGRERDGLTGLYYYRARWYDPQQGRFLSEYPIGFNGGDVNLYAYVKNNPAKFTDPQGTTPAILGGLAAVAVEFGLHYYLGERAKGFYPIDGDPHGHKKHCYVNCMSTRIHLGSPVTATVFSIGQELPTIVFPQESFRDELTESYGDMQANGYGQRAAFVIWKSCKELCEGCPN